MSQREFTAPPSARTRNRRSRPRASGTCVRRAGNSVHRCFPAPPAPLRAARRESADAQSPATASRRLNQPIGWLLRVASCRWFYKAVVRLSVIEGTLDAKACSPRHPAQRAFATWRPDAPDASSTPHSPCGAMRLCASPQCRSPVGAPGSVMQRSPAGGAHADVPSPLPSCRPTGQRHRSATRTQPPTTPADAAAKPCFLH